MRLGAKARLGVRSQKHEGGGEAQVDEKTYEDRDHSCHFGACVTFPAEVETTY